MRKSNSVKSSNVDIPSTLEEHPFYGIQLDDEQKIFRDSIWNPEKKIVFCNSVAGTGKTFISLGVANLLVQYGLYDGIDYIVAPVQEEKQGYLPGSVEDKTAPYKMPLLDTLVTLGINPFTAIESDDIEIKKQGTGYIRFMPHTFMRGMSIDKRVILIDEAENFYASELKKVLTRVKDSCKVVVIGHTGQCDLFKNPSNSGFPEAIKLFGNTHDPRVSICTLTHNYRGWVSQIADNLDSEIQIQGA